MIKPIVTYPSHILNVVSSDANDEVWDTLPSLIKDMYDTMHAGQGIGLSAIQIGVPLKVIVYDTPDHNPFHMINPTIISASDEMVNMKEGCLSVPGYREDRDRHKTVTVNYFDVCHNEYTVTFVGITAFCVQHEIDHLNGDLFIDQLSSFKQQRIKDKVKKFLKNNKGDPAYD